MNECDKQANDFLKETKTSFEAVFETYGKHFDDDKESRNIYKITLKRNGKQFSFNFGQSINDTNAGIDPTAYDVLSCLTKYDPGSFDDFCSDFGYDNDSRKAEKTYKAVVKEYNKVNAMFNDVIEKLADIS